MGITFYTAQLGEVWFACICDQSGAESFNCVFNLPGLFQKFQVPSICNIYCTFQKHKNNENQKPPSQLHFSPPSILITVTSNEPWNTPHRSKFTNHQSPITNHKPWPFEPVEVNFCFLRGPLRWLMAAKNANVSWFFNFGIRVFLKSTVIGSVL